MLRTLLATLAAVPLALAAAPDKPTLPAAATRPVDYARDIQPIFDRACVRCHGPDKARSGLRLDAGALALKGGNSGAVVKPRDGANSRLVHLVAGLEAGTVMPPPKAKPLSAAEVGLLRAWIDQGAKVPAAPAVARGATKSSHWAFQPIRRHAAPAVSHGAWPRNDLDAFVLARLEALKITPSPEADRMTLIRRLSLDLLGLPPAPDEVDAFVNDARPDAYERLVERLLASPHFGERWGRHWLDLARYADSDGFEKDTGRPHAWRYRHWVIEALNGDLGYDEFTIEQLAGDLLPGATAEQKAATGFHRNTLTNKEGGVDQEQFRVEAVVDRANTTARVWLGLTLGCAQCHDHKYDPLSQREYYQFFAFFNSDIEVDVPAPAVGFPGPAPLPAAQQAKLAALQQKERAYVEKQLPVKLAVWERGLSAAQKQALPLDVREALELPAARRTARQQARVAEEHAKRDPELVKLRKQAAALRAGAKAGPMAQALALGRPRKTNVMIRGDFLRPGVEVTADVPAVLPPLRAKGAATRLELAQWLVAGESPLPARVAVNWAWHKLFGRGLVPTLDDFGTQGERPSHPELLDWLASEFVRQNWSLKSLLRVIVTSATYRQGSAVRDELLARDPYNALLARQARLRLEAEGVRDVALTASGLLARRVGGPSVRPPQPAGISELTYAGSAKWVESTGPDRYRRGLYTWFQRTSPYPMLLTFDAPDANVSCSRRERSNTPLQALTLLNDAAFVECAQALGRRVAECQGGVEARLRYAFRLCVARPPTASEQARLRALYDELRELASADEAGAKALAGASMPRGVSAAEGAAWVGLARVVLNLDEAVTRE